jgi:hypothetical protein
MSVLRADQNFTGRFCHQGSLTIRFDHKEGVVYLICKVYD